MTPASQAVTHPDLIAREANLQKTAEAGHAAAAADRAVDRVHVRTFHLVQELAQLRIRSMLRSLE